MNNLLNWFVIIFLLGSSYFAINPLFISGFFPMHDDTQVARVFEMKQALSDGMFPVRWVKDLGYHYGYPIFNFYAPLAYYVGGFINLLGIDSLLATKIMMGIGILLAAFFMYLLAKEFWGKSGGLIAALLYLYAPYHALNIYVRGDVAEFWAYAFVPLAFYGIWKTYTEKSWQYVVIGSLGFSAIILSHNLTAMMVTPFLTLFAVVLFILAKKEKRGKAYLPFLIIVLGVITASFYWLPVFAEMKYTDVLSQVGGGADYKDHFVCLSQLWDSPWGFGGSTPTCTDGMSYKIGKVHLVLFAISLVGLFFIRKLKEHNKFIFCLLAFLSTIFAIFLMFSSSQFIWDSFSQMAFFQYPWRFLLIVTFFVSFIGGGIILIARTFLKSPSLIYLLIGGFSIAIIYQNAELFNPQTILNKTAGNYTNSFLLRWEVSKISDEYLPPGFAVPKNVNEVPLSKVTPIKNKIEVLSVVEKTQEILAKVNITEKTDLLIHHAYFPAWQVFVDNKQVDYKITQKGLVITVPAGEHTILLRFVQTPIEVIANMLSLAGVIIMILGIIKQRKDKKHATKTT